MPRDICHYNGPRRPALTFPAENLREIRYSPRRALSLMTSFWRETGFTCLAGVLVAAACGLLLQLDAHFFWRDDAQIYYVPVLFEIHRALSHAEWPLLTPLSWVVSSLAGEYGAGVFSPVVLGGAWFAVSLGLSMAGTGAAYSTYLLAITAMGAFRLGRAEGLSAPLALCVALVAALNGWSLIWGGANWYTPANGFAALTWSWWSLCCLARRPTDWAALTAATICVTLLLLSGWPHTIIMMALLSLWIVAREGITRERLFALAIAWGTAAGLSAPAWLNFLEFLPHTFRAANSSIWQWEWLVPVWSLPALALPTLVVSWNTFGAMTPHIPLELINGLFPVGVALLLLSRGRWRQALRWELGLVIGLFMVCCLPSLGMFRWSFRWLPVAHLALMLVAGKIYMRHEALRTQQEHFRWSYNPGVLALLAVLGTHAIARAIPVLDSKMATLYGITAAVWAGAEELARRKKWHIGWLATALTFCILLGSYVFLPTRTSVPTWIIPETIRHRDPLRENHRYFVIASQEDYFPGGFAGPGFGPHLRAGMTHLLAGVEAINGYSSLSPKGPNLAFHQGVHGYLTEESITRVLHHDIQPGGLLERLGVHGVLLANSKRSARESLQRAGWILTSEGPEGSVFHREGLPAETPRCVTRVRFAPYDAGHMWWAALSVTDGAAAVAANDTHPAGAGAQFGTRDVELREKSRNHLVLQVEPGTEPALIAVMRPWVPGWQAELAGQPLEVIALDGLNTAIKIPAGVGGPVMLRFNPWGLRWGLWLMSFSGLLLGVIVWRRRRHAQSGSGLKPGLSLQHPAQDIPT